MHILNVSWGCFYVVNEYLARSNWCRGGIPKFTLLWGCNWNSNGKLKTTDTGCHPIHGLSNEGRIKRLT